jgi:hypothetical protein
MPFTRWLPTFLAFPLGGYLAFATVGALEGPCQRPREGSLPEP